MLTKKLSSMTPGRMSRFHSLYSTCIALLMASGAGAAVTLTGSSQFNASTNDYTYMYSVNNLDAMEDAVLVTLAVDRTAQIVGLSAPMGFMLTYDAVANVVNFAEDFSVVTTESFAPLTTVSGFSFTSPVGPRMGAYMAFDAAGNEFAGLVAAPVPEPTSLLAGSLGLGIVFRRRRQRSAA